MPQPTFQPVESFIKFSLIAAEGEAAKEYRQQAMAWLRKDVLGRRSVLRQIAELLAKDDVGGERRQALEASRHALQDHLTHARERDPDLASLRGSPGFQKLFEQDGQE